VTDHKALHTQPEALGTEGGQARSGTKDFPYGNPGMHKAGTAIYNYACDYSIQKYFTRRVTGILAVPIVRSVQYCVTIGKRG